MSSQDFAATYARCAQFIASFYRNLDTGDAAAAASAFGRLGTWLRLGTTLKGAEEVRTALDGRAPERKSCHSISNLVIAFLSDGAVEARYYVTAWVQEPGEQAKATAILDSCDVIDLGENLQFRDKRASILMKFA